jgi:uncharacterized protein (TIGR02246 family)
MDGDEKEIRDLVDTWMSATREGDLDRVLELMAEDVVFLVPGKPPMMGREAFAAAARESWAGGPMKFDGKSDIQEIRVLGDWAYMWQRLSVEGTMPDGRAMKRSGHTLTILRRENGRWVLARDANLLA